MAFTSWADLVAKMKDDMTSGNWRVESYSLGTRTVKYRSLDEFTAALAYCEARAAVEAGQDLGAVEAVPAGRFW